MKGVEGKVQSGIYKARVLKEVQMHSLADASSESEIPERGFLEQMKSTVRTQRATITKANAQEWKWSREARRQE